MRNISLDLEEASLVFCWCLQTATEPGADLEINPRSIGQAQRNRNDDDMKEIPEPHA